MEKFYRQHSEKASTGDYTASRLQGHCAALEIFSERASLKRPSNRQTGELGFKNGVIDDKILEVIETVDIVNDDVVGGGIASVTDVITEAKMKVLFDDNEDVRNDDLLTMNDNPEDGDLLTVVQDDFRAVSLLMVIME